MFGFAQLVCYLFNNFVKIKVHLLQSVVNLLMRYITLLYIIISSVYDVSLKDNYALIIFTVVLLNVINILIVQLYIIQSRTQTVYSRCSFDSKFFKQHLGV